MHNSFVNRPETIGCGNQRASPLCLCGEFVSTLSASRAMEQPPSPAVRKEFPEFVIQFTEPERPTPPSIPPPTNTLRAPRFAATPRANLAVSDDVEASPLLRSDASGADAVDCGVDAEHSSKTVGKPSPRKRAAASCPPDNRTPTGSGAGPKEKSKKKDKAKKKRTPEPGFSAASVARLLREGRTEWRRLALGSICLFGAAAANLVVPSLFGGILDALTTHDPSGIAIAQRNCGLLVRTWMRCRFALRVCTSDLLPSHRPFASPPSAVYTILGALLSFGRSYMFAYAGEQLVARVRRKLFRSMLLQEVEFYDNCRTGELVSRLSSDTVILKDAVTSDIAMGCVET